MGCLRILFILIILSESPAALTTRWCLCVLFDRITGLTGWGVAAQTDCHDGPVLKRMGCLRILFILNIVRESRAELATRWWLCVLFDRITGLTGWGVADQTDCHDGPVLKRMGCLRILFILIILSDSQVALTTRWCLCILFDRITGLTGWGVAAQTDCHDGPVLKRMGCLRILFILIILSEISAPFSGFVCALVLVGRARRVTGWGVAVLQDW